MVAPSGGAATEAAGKAAARPSGKMTADFVMGGFAAVVAKSGAAPVERVKLLLQNQGEMLKRGHLQRPYKGIANCFSRVLREEGVLSLWRGNQANVIRYFPTQAMAELGETSVSSPPPSNLTKAKSVVVRVKRKLSQARLDAFWLEINERPLKRALLDLGSLSISDSSTGKVLEESRTKKLLVQHVETIRHSEAIKDVLHSFLQPGSSGSKEFKRKIEERRSAHKQDKKQDQLRSAAIQKHEDLARNARFEQIWKSRRGCTDPDEDSLRELCHLYDVVQVDVEDRTSRKVQKSEVFDLEDNAILCNYLPLIREYLPTAAAEIESDMRAYASREDNYVYDLYTMDDGLKNNEADKATDYPLVQVDVDDEYYDGPLQSEYESDDSNAEDNPRNDYPDEESSRDDEDEDRDPFNDLEGSDSQYEEEIVDVDEESEDD